ncbi:hypothetical protein Nmel_003535 [Mimus melanotis]
MPQDNHLNFSLCFVITSGLKEISRIFLRSKSAWRNKFHRFK